MKKTPVISFVGKHNVGKTTILTKVVSQLNSKGISTAIIKHSRHNLDVALNGDAEKLFAAGANIVYAMSPQMSIMYSNTKERTIRELEAELDNKVDLIITEGYKQESYPKIEILRQEVSRKIMNLDHVIARVADFTPPEHDSNLALFDFNQHQELACYIIDVFKIK